MAIRIPDPSPKTEVLLGQILLAMHAEPETRVAFLCESGTGEDILQRLRVMISRKRATLTTAGRRPKKFRLRSTVHPETHSGIRYDCVIVWKQVTDIHVMTEQLEGILSCG
jgi:hypothetical protein